ncbi:9705_t:CDS:10 [Funneliformis caledonium]|uniref:9705_t:CDS:1 n=1 Tax=Funneliformis caledonium TaxID=1117310 RepID=A0A9N9APX3_9GLOM|nr:9705_t:CDS:10 [Funneliformis caledonium]
MQNNKRKQVSSDLASNTPKIRKYVTSDGCKLNIRDKYWGMLIPINEETSDRIGSIYLEAEYQTFGKNETRNGYQHMPSDYELHCMLSKNEHGMKITKICGNVTYINPKGEDLTLNNAGDNTVIVEGCLFLIHLNEFTAKFKFLLWECHCGSVLLYDKDDEITIKGQGEEEITNKDNNLQCAVHKYTIIRQLGQIKDGTLHDLIKSEHRFTKEELVSLAKNMSVTLNEFHEKGLVYRDLSVTPFNIILCDFGLCKEAEKIMPGRPGGTKAYFSPEIINKYGKQTKFHDYFSLGIVLLECIMQNKFYGYDKVFQDASSIRQKQIIEKTCAQYFERKHSWIKEINDEGDL